MDPYESPSGSFIVVPKLHPLLRTRESVMVWGFRAGGPYRLMIELPSTGGALLSVGFRVGLNPALPNNEEYYPYIPWFRVLKAMQDLYIINSNS